MMVVMVVLMVVLLATGMHHGTTHSHDATKAGEPTVYIERGDAQHEQQRER